VRMSPRQYYVYFPPFSSNTITNDEKAL